MTDGTAGSETILSHGEGGGAPPVANVAPGTVIGGYAVESLAGSGGMGVVYRAHDTELGRTVALKLIGGGESDTRLRELFVRESLTAASIEHPNVLPVYRTGAEDGRLYIAMRFVDGASLQDLIDESPDGMPPGRAARIVARVADALDAAHAKGLVHRDVKPGNVLISDPDGEEQVYLSDFGLTVHGAGARASGGPGRAGTLAYLAPEQVRGEGVDARTDVYALGCLLFHALTGRTPFPTGDEQAALDAHLHARVPVPSQVVPGLPPALDGVVRRAMAKRPEDRFPSAGELGRAALAARYDVAMLVSAAESATAEVIAAGLRESGMLPLVSIAGEPRAAEGVRAAEACAVLVGREGLGDWARDGLAVTRQVAAHDRAFRMVLVLLPGAPGPGDPGLAYLADHPWVDLRAGAGDPLAATDLVRALRGADIPAGLPQADGVSPYRGLEAFREEDAPLYFGREHDVARIIEQLRTGRFVTVMGPSGSGKSSLVQAGLLPALRRDAATGASDRRVLELLPGARPLAALAAQIARLPGAGAPSAADLAADERALDIAVAAALEGRPPDERVLLVVDQLEEAFTLCHDEGERLAFLGCLVYAATIPGGRTMVVATMRADFYHRLAEHPELRGLVATRQVLLGPLDARGLRRAIEEPARRCGLDLEPGLTRRILTDVADRPGTLPLLEHLLLEVWRLRRDRTLTLEGYAASGGVEGALARRANDVYGAMDPGRQAIARRVLLRLTQPGEGTEDTRRRAERRELVIDPAEQAEVDAVVDALAEARLVTTGTDEATGERVVEVTHEALIRGWPELRGWIDEDRDRLRAERRLSDAAAEWDRGGRDEGALYRGARLLAWQERDISELTPLEREYLAASRERDERDRTARRRRVRIAIGSLGAAVAIIAGVAIFAVLQRNEAAGQRDESQSRALAASSTVQLAGDPGLALLLARRAVDTEPTAEAEEALRRAVAVSTGRFEFDGDGGPEWDVAVTRDGGRIVTGDAAGRVHVWSADDGSTLRTLDTGDSEVRGVAIASNGTIAAGGSDGTVRVWAPGDSTGRVLTGHAGIVNSVAFGADGRTLASAGDDGTVRLWPVGGTQGRVLRASTMPIRKVAIADDGRIAAGGDDGVVHLWTASGRPAGTLAGHTGGVFSVAFAPDGRVASASSDLTVRIWPRRGGTRPEVIQSAAFSAVDEVAFDADGSHVVTAGQDGTVRIFTSAGERVAVLRGHDGAVLGAAFLPDGRVVSTGQDGTGRVWQWDQGLPVAEVSAPATFSFQGPARFTSDGALLVSGLLDGSVRSWAPGGDAMRMLVPPGPEGYTATSMAVSADDSRVAVAGIDGVVTVHRIAGGADDPVRLEGHKGPVWAMDFTPDGSGLVTGGDDRTVRLWDLSTTTGRRLGRHEGYLQTVDVSPDGTRAASAGEDGVIKLWPLTVAEATPQELTGHDGIVYSVGFSPDGLRLASGGDDRTVRTWDLRSGTGTVLGEHASAVFSAGFNADGRLTISAANDGPRVWDWERGIVVFQPTGLGRTSFSARLSPDNQRLAISTIDDRIRVLACQTCGSLDEVRELATERSTRELTATEEETFGG